MNHIKTVAGWRDRWNAMESFHKAIFLGVLIFAAIALAMLIHTYWGVPAVYPSGEGG